MWLALDLLVALSALRPLDLLLGDGGSLAVHRTLGRLGDSRLAMRRRIACGKGHVNGLIDLPVLLSVLGHETSQS